MEKFKKIDKEYCITDDSVNVYKYRCLTAGLQLDEVKKNPIGFLMHKRDKGVVVRWEDFRIDGSKLFAKPVVNLAHPEGASIVDQIENGFLNAASVGHIVCLDASDDASLKLEGQTGPTVTKWFPREISLVDIPGNYNALVNLYDIEDNKLNLADFVKPKNNENMSKILLTAVMLTALNLSDNATEHEAGKAFQDLLDKAKKTDGLEKDLVAKTTELDALKSASVTKEVADLVAKGTADKKLTKEMGDKLIVDYALNPSGLKSLIDTMPAQISVVENLSSPEAAAKFEGKSWDELYATDELEGVRTKFPDLYEKLKNEKYPQK